MSAPTAVFNDTKITLTLVNEVIRLHRKGVSALSPRAVADGAAMKLPGVPLPYLSVKSVAVMDVLFGMLEAQHFEDAMARGVITPAEAIEALKYIRGRAGAILDEVEAHRPLKLVKS